MTLVLITLIRKTVLKKRFTEPVIEATNYLFEFIN